MTRAVVALEPVLGHRRGDVFKADSELAWSLEQSGSVAVVEHLRREVLACRASELAAHPERRPNRLSPSIRPRAMM
jgi:hypothetical protein